MTIRLEFYLELERLMLAAEHDEKIAEGIRDAMEPIWYSLSKEEHEFLDNRTVSPIKSIEGLRVPAGTQLKYVVSRPVKKRRLTSGQLVKGWRKVA